MTQVDEGPESSNGPSVLTYGVPTVGEVLAERYQLQEHINDDAFGRQIWRGVDVVLRRPVAVVLRYPGGESAVEMLDAAVAASRVVHPHLVDVYDAIDEGTRAYVVREWVDGGSLAEYVTEAPLDPERATAVASSVASAVAAVHATGIVHGNVHPGTVLIGSDGRVVLADARADDAATPESDVRAIGAVLYCALTGYWPHAEAGPTNLPDAVRDPSGALAAPRQIRGGLPSHLSDLATDLLDAELAPPSADVLAAELGRLDAEREDDLFGGSSPLDFNHAAYGEPTVAEPHRGVGRKLAVGVAGLLVLAIVGLVLAVKFLPSTSGGTTPAVIGTTGNGNGTGTGGTGPVAGKPIAVPLNASQVRVVDPQGSGDEWAGAGAVVDADPESAWKTDQYKNNGKFGNLKKGMGILIDLGKPTPVILVQVSLTVPGATIELKTGTTTPAATNNSAADTALVQSYQDIGAPKTNSGPNAVFNADGKSVRYLLVWITQLPQVPDDGTKWQEGIQNIQVKANSN